MKESQVGWIKLYRKLLESPIFTSEKGLKIWVWCMLKATHNGYKQYVGRSLVVLKPGEFVFGRKAASGELRIPPTTIYDWIDFLQNDGYIDIKKTNKYSVISINNWSNYQASDIKTDTTTDNNSATKIPPGKPSTKTDTTTDTTNQAEKSYSPTPEPTTNGQQLGTNKNVKEIYIYSSRNCLTDELCGKVANEFSVSESSVKGIRDDLILHCKSKNVRYADYHATLQIWVKKALKEKKIFKQKRQASALKELPITLTPEQREQNRIQIAMLKRKLGRSRS